jgi:hypothetical protein
MSESGDEKPHQGRRRRIVGGRDSGGDGGGGRGIVGGGRGGNSGEKELASQLILIQSKRFYIDVKENQRGRFIKLAEVGVGGRKSRILMTMSAAAEFKSRLVEFSELHSSLGPSHGTGDTANADTATTGVSSSSNSAAANKSGQRNNSGSATGGDNDGLIKSENQRGRFLRVSMVVSRGPRAYLAIPAQGLIEFKDHLGDILDRFALDLDENSSDIGGNAAINAGRSRGTSPKGAAKGGGAVANQAHDNVENLPESKSLRADNKTFYFDCGSNQRGVFLKISEVRQNRFRTSITIPITILKQFQEQISQLNLNSSTPPVEAAATVTTAAAASAGDKTAETPTSNENTAVETTSVDNPAAAITAAIDSTSVKTETETT